MKKAVYYARVSTSLQEERGTIESQKTELIKQIKSDGNILVKEYLDDGWSGSRLDRPALDELRKDLKIDLFEMVYFLDSDRIARDSTYQNLIIAEILKYNKQIVIKGKDYIHNPENKFTLTVLGAVNELEKAKIVERSKRGQRERSRNNEIMTGSYIYGYDYIAKTASSAGHFEINQEEAQVVKDLFNQYLNEHSSITELVKFIESKGVKNKSGSLMWSKSSIHGMLKNTSYYGLRYYNMRECIESDDPEKRCSKNLKTKRRVREQKEWIPVALPAIISKELFDAVQNKLSNNKAFLRKLNSKYILNGLIKCGYCGHNYGSHGADSLRYYRCNYKAKIGSHLKEAVENMPKCSNLPCPSKIEEAVWDTVNNEILKPSIIKRYIDFLSSNTNDFNKTSEKKLEVIKVKIAAVEAKKGRILDLYADGKLDKDLYMSKIGELVNLANVLQGEQLLIEKKVSQIKNRQTITKSIGDYCLLAQKRLKKLDVSQKNNFLKEIINEIIYFSDSTGRRAIIKGLLPITIEGNIVSSQYCTHGIGGTVGRDGDSDDVCPKNRTVIG